jgi:hypothetical protein
MGSENAVAWVQLFQAAEPDDSVSWIQILGAAGFGALIGWFVYYINRYRKGDVQFSDLTTVIGILGGAVVISLFKPESDLFGAYGIGLFIGFFGYYLSLIILIRSSDNFNADFLLDGRRRVIDGSGFYIPGDFVRPAADLHYIPQLGAAQNVTVNPMQAPMLSAPAPEAVAAQQLQDETRQAEVSAEALRTERREAQRTLEALARATEKAAQGVASSLQPTPEPGD